MDARRHFERRLRSFACSRAARTLPLEVAMAKARKREMAGTLSGSAVGTIQKDSERSSDQDAGQRAAPQNAGDTTAAAHGRDRVAMRAYELYLARGGADGAALDDWLTAERELNFPDSDRTND